MTVPTPPSLALSLTEFSRASGEALRGTLSLNRLVRQHRGGDGHPVLVMPGYAAADGSTRTLRRFVERIGYRPFSMDLGRNIETAEERIRSVDDAIRFRQRMTDEVVNRIREIRAQTGEKLSLVGWSMGGLYAVDASRAVPGLLRQVITLGSPFGDPRGTSLFKLMRRLSGSTVPLENQDYDGWTARAVAAVPTRVMYSRRDGIVPPAIAMLPESPLVEYREIGASHLAFPLHPHALSQVGDWLKQHPQQDGRSSLTL